MSFTPFAPSTRASRLVQVSAQTLLCVLIAIIVGAMIDILNNGNSGVLNVWREVRRPFGVGVVCLLFIHGIILKLSRQLRSKTLIWSLITILIWLFLEPLWPRIERIGLAHSRCQQKKHPKLFCLDFTYSEAEFEKTKRD